MKTMMIPATLCFLLSGLGAARADVAVGVSASLAVEPTVPVPTIMPPAPPVDLPPPPVQVGYVAPPRVVMSGPTAAPGQWVFTAQYGWLYMPYGHRFAFTHRTGPYAYAYYPSYGWRWLSAPWMVGTGPYPYFGVHGPYAYGWYRGLHRAGHPMAMHYGHVQPRPWGAPHAAAPYRGYGPRAMGAHGPARPIMMPRMASPARASMVSHRGYGGPVRGAMGPRGGRR